MSTDPTTPTAPIPASAPVAGAALDIDRARRLELFGWALATQLMGSSRMSSMAQSAELVLDTAARFGLTLVDTAAASSGGDPR